MNMRMRRLVSDYDAIRELARRHPRVAVEGVGGNPPERYRLVLTVRSLREQGEEVVVATSHRVEIVLPAGYPRDAPICRMHTPVFHPNIAPHAICIGDHWTAAEPLDLMVQRIGEMLAYQSYNVKSPLNGRAAQWAEENVSRLPVDAEPFFVDLAAAPPPVGASGCSNCAAVDVPLAPCGAGHSLCVDCDAQCPTCSAVLCLACGRTSCPACAGAPCANCGASGAVNCGCTAGHSLCAECSVRCEPCNRVLCLTCGEYPCSTCAAR